MPENFKDFTSGIDLKDEDIFEAMKSIPGYLDITPGVLRRSIAWRSRGRPAAPGGPAGQQPLCLAPLSRILVVNRLE